MKFALQFILWDLDYIGGNPFQDYRSRCEAEALPNLTQINCDKTIPKYDYLDDWDNHST